MDPSTVAAEMMSRYTTPEVLAAVLVTSAVWGLVAALLRCSPRIARQGGKMSERDWERHLEEKEAVPVKDASPPQHGKGNGVNGEGQELFIPYSKYSRMPVGDMKVAAAEFYSDIDRRRTVRDYSPEGFPIEILQDCIKAAGTAPSGANLQPWTYVIVQDPKVKAQVRAIVEDEEAVNYARRMKESWKEDLRHIGTDATKPYLDIAPYLVCVFKHTYRIEDDERLAVYYPEQSVGISVGMFQTAVHRAGLCTLTSTPMGAEAPLRELLGRPENERLYLLMPVGYPADNVKVPNITRKSLGQISAVV